MTICLAWIVTLHLIMMYYNGFIDHDVDVVSGIYRQRKDNQVLEIYGEHGGNLDWSDISDNKLFKIGGCGFGCVLVKREVFESVGTACV